MNKNLTDQSAETYKMLRRGVTVLAFLFPPLLWLGGYFLAGLPLEGSMSAYYHASASPGVVGLGVMRNVFVGFLFAIGMILFVYQGYTKLEDYALNVAGTLAWGIAYFPMAWPAGVATDSNFSMHGACAISFFICIGYVCIFRAGDTLTLIPDEATRKLYRRTYRWLGVAMVAFPILAWVLISKLPLQKSAIFFVELAGIYVFATYWVVKGREAAKTQIEEKAAQGMLQVPSHKMSDVLRPLPVAPAPATPPTVPPGS